MLANYYNLIFYDLSSFILEDIEKKMKQNIYFKSRVHVQYNIKTKKKTPKPGNLSFKWLLSLRVSKKSNK